MPNCLPTVRDKDFRPGPKAATLAAVLAVAGVLAATGAAPSIAATDSLREVEVQAALIYNFTRFVEWPAEVLRKGGPLVICIGGRGGDLGTALAVVNGKTAQEHPISVEPRSSPAELAGCHALVLASEGDPARDAFLKGAAEKPILTVGVGAEFAPRGGVIGLVRSGERVQFEVNMDSARKAGLKMPSQLLRLARSVK